MIAVALKHTHTHTHARTHILPISLDVINKHFLQNAVPVGLPRANGVSRPALPDAVRSAEVGRNRAADVVCKEMSIQGKRFVLWKDQSIKNKKDGFDLSASLSPSPDG